jgi:hypothetical protein
MALPVIENVFRCTLNFGSTGGVIAHNVLHLLSDTGDEADLADKFETHLTTNMLSVIHDGVGIESFSIIELNGTDATQIFTNGSSADGQATGDIIPAQAAVLSLHTATRGPRGRGRLFLGPLSESVNIDGLVSGVANAATVAAWIAFAAAMQTDGWTLGVASYVHADFHPVLSFSMRNQAGTLRRRQNQLL